MTLLLIGCIQGLASYPGLPMFFNVSREKSGRPGRSGDVMDAVGLSPPTRPRNLLHTEKLAKTAINGTTGQIYVQARALGLRELSAKRQRRELGIDVTLERLARFTFVASSSPFYFQRVEPSDAIEIGGTSTTIE